MGESVGAHVTEKGRDSKELRRALDEGVGQNTPHPVPAAERGIPDGLLESGSPY